MILTADDEATARAFIAYYLHDVASTAEEEEDPALIEAAAAERTAWEGWGRLEGRTPQLVYLWALQNAVRTGEDAAAGRVEHEDFTRATENLNAVRLWLTAEGYVTP